MSEAGPDIKSEELDLVALADKLLDDLQYNGYDSVAEREKIMRLLSNNDIIRLVTSYVQLGNNIRRAIGRVRAQHNELINLLNASGTTLARIGISFMPLTYAIRRRGVQNKVIGSRFSDMKTPAELQDVAFQGWKGTIIKDFLVKFSAVLPDNKGTRNEVNTIDDWINIAETGFRKDQSVAQIMRDDLTIEHALQWLSNERNRVAQLQVSSPAPSLVITSAKKGPGKKQ